MVFKIVIKSVAYGDLEEAYAWYNNKADGLGERFALQSDKTIEKIRDRPGPFSYIKYPVRRCLVEKFPYKSYIFLKEKQFLF